MKNQIINKIIYINITFILFLFSFLYTYPQSILDYGIQIRTEIDYSNRKITLNWDKDSNTYNYFIYKKKVTDSIFGDYIAKLQPNQTTFIDTLYDFEIEYKIEKDANKYFAYGYIVTGLNIDIDKYNGRCLILVDSTIYTQISQELDIYKNDLIADNYNVLIFPVPRAEKFYKNKVKLVKDLVKQIYSLYNDLTTLILIGRVPVPYSGDFAIDGHDDHYGAWPTDAYYADIDGMWTDTLTNRFITTDERLKNIPNDGKFDQLLFPSDIDLQMGRIDLYNLTYFKESEVDLIKNYLKKVHLFKSGKFNIPRKAALIDNFGTEYKEGFAASGWTNFSSLLSFDSIDYLPNRFILTEKEYLWYYGCGPGAYTASHEALYSEELATYDFKTAFVMAFGSYNGDWDSENNLLRSVLASKPLGLTCVWSGRPHWFFHHMSFGKSIGYSTRLTQNVRANEYPTVSPYARRMNHIALMGDPTLRMEYPERVDILLATYENDLIKLEWNKINDKDVFYKIYRFDYNENRYLAISDIPIYDNFFIDKNPLLGINKYMIKTVKNTKNTGGFYINYSLGTFSNEIIFPKDDNFQLIISPNPAKSHLNIFYNLEDQIVNIKIFDINGKEVRNYNNIYSAYSIIQLPLIDSSNNSLSSGLYFIEIYFENGKNINRKFQINN